MVADIFAGGILTTKMFLTNCDRILSGFGRLSSDCRRYTNNAPFNSSTLPNVWMRMAYFFGSIPFQLYLEM